MIQLEELSIEITNECTLACKHCSSGSAAMALSNELAFGEIVDLMEQAREMGATVLSLSGGNPLLRNTLPAMVGVAEDFGYSKILLYTTGHNRTGPHIWQYRGVSDLKIVDNLVWVFSLHSHKAYVNDNIMYRYGTLGNIVASISYLVECGQEVEVHMVPMQPNFKHINAVRDLCGEMGVSRLSLLRFVPQTRGHTNRPELSISKADFAWIQTCIAIEIQKDHPVELRVGCPMDFRHSMELTIDKAKPCHAGDDLILVRPDGSVHPCAAWKSLPSDSNVRDASLQHIWTHSAVFCAIRSFKEFARNGHDSLGCNSCSHLSSCLTGCPAQRLHAYGKSLDDLYLRWSDPLCPRGVQPPRELQPEQEGYGKGI